MSGVLRIAAEMNLIDITTRGSARCEYRAGVTNVDFFGPAPLIVGEVGRQRELRTLMRAIGVAWDDQSVVRNRSVVAALRSAADRIENGGYAADVLMPMLLSAITQAASGV